MTSNRQSNGQNNIELLWGELSINLTFSLNNFNYIDIEISYLFCIQVELYFIGEHL